MKLVILDRDGVINYDSEHFIKSVAEWKALPGSPEAIAKLTQAGYRVVVATNQSGIGRGLFDMAALNAMHNKMHKAVAQAGGRIEAVFYCPDTDASESFYRKPSPGMLLAIAERYNVPLENLPLVGCRVRSLTLDDIDNDLILREALECQAAEETARQLAASLPEHRVGLVHGRVKGSDREAVMRGFAAGEIDVLVATTVIEVGVDVAHATVMVVLDADRFGVSQLHQLRGRVGRGGHPGLCLLVTQAEQDTPALQRLSAVAATTDGFELSRVDLEQRREGDVLGAAQSGGRSSLKLLSVLEHEDEIVAARAAAADVVGDDPQLRHHPALAEAVRRLDESEQADYLEKA